ncbi:MAG: hypothetical protein WBD05_00010 [Phycisphaerae bacterium]
MPLTPAEQLAAYLMAPEKVPRPALGSLPDEETLRAFVEEHKLPLEEVIAVNGLEDDPVVQAEPVRRVLAWDRERHRKFRDEFAAFRERLDALGIRHCLIKAVHFAPYRSENVDILIPLDAIGQAEVKLIDMGHIRNRYYRDRYKLLYDRIAESRVDGMIHVHKNVSWYAAFIEPERVFESAVPGAEAGLVMPSAEVALAITACHALYEEASVKCIEHHKVLCLLRRGVDWGRLWELAEHRGFGSGLALVLLILDRQHRTYVGEPLFEPARLEAMRIRLSRLDGSLGHYRRRVAGRELRSPHVVSKYFARRMLFCELWRSRIITFGTKVSLTARILRDGFKQVTGWRPKPPTVVAVCGPDGSGKTTQVEHLATILDGFELEPVCSWIRIGDSPILNRLKGPFRRRLRAEAEVGQVSEQGVFKSRLLRCLWPPIAVADYLLRQYAALLWAFVRGRVVIADRYHIDALVDLAMRCGPEVLGRRWLRMVMGLLPKARPAFVLQVPQETLRRRRSDDYIEGISDRQLGYYRKASELMGGVAVPAERSPDDVAEEMAREVLRRFYRRV